MGIRRRFEIRSTTLVIALVGMLIAYPQLEGAVSRAWLGLVVSVVLVAAVYSVSTDRRRLVTASLLGAPAVVATWVPDIGLALPLVAMIVQVLFVLYVVGCLMRFILNESEVDLEKLAAAAAVYLLLGMAWSLAFRIVLLQNPGAFRTPGLGETTASDLLYFSYVTLTTVGYGDITPVSKLARSLAVLEGMVGIFFVAVLVARLVALYDTQSDRRS